MKLKQTNSKRYLFLTLIAILVLSLSYLGYSYWEAKSTIKDLSDPKKRLELEKKEVEEILKKAGKHLMLPTGEVPTVANINDAAKLAKEQPFYGGAQDGDKVLVFVKNRIAIVYSPERDIIVNMGPVILNEKPAEVTDTTQDKAPTATSSLPITNLEINSLAASEVQKVIKIDVRNGSNMTSAAKIFADSLPKEKYQVINIANAANKNYSGNIMVNLQGASLNDLNGRLEAALVDKLPIGEAASTADVVVIIGNKK